MSVAATTTGSMQARRAGILTALAEAGRVDVGELARTLGVAEETVRRDLRSLESEGLLVRAHGGAIPAGAGVVAEAEGIRAVAAAVLELLPVASGVYLDGGPVSEALAALLPVGRRIRIVTASVPVALAAAALGDPPEIHFLGGVVGADGTATGHGPRELASALNLEVAVVEPTGIGAGGRLLAADPDRAAVTESAADAADTVLMVSGPRGLAGTGLAGSIPFSRVHRAVLDPAAGTPTIVRSLAEHGVDVRVLEGVGA
ncbi:DeoR family transcriptional regulator [Herbiconiux sp. CPCC 205763]|uniref:Lactose phosphotransferase system repressor n=1 Tax=Herbiconiux aconitum TaxID=2970913 RepID=A0ABT2GV35_9MICO|nr:DeoR family transcriptional regulator [Herbiconiux aconitum]MCS5720074.1 DeoR family transcriptional regulator [Herbiconiux aconitum]